MTTPPVPTKTKNEVHYRLANPDRTLALYARDRCATCSMWNPDGDSPNAQSGTCDEVMGPIYAGALCDDFDPA